MKFLLQQRPLTYLHFKWACSLLWIKSRRQRCDGENIFKNEKIFKIIQIKGFPLFTCDDLRLSVDDFFCGACLPLLQLLPDAGDDAQTALQSVSHLRTNQNQVFTWHTWRASNTWQQTGFNSLSDSRGLKWNISIWRIMKPLLLGWMNLHNMSEYLTAALQEILLI